jgi:hypothetical protein
VVLPPAFFVFSPVAEIQSIGERFFIPQNLPRISAALRGLDLTDADDLENRPDEVPLDREWNIHLRYAAS